ncbi:hypothetical protein ACF0H5_019134 [Mactra antiquata]
MFCEKHDEIGCSTCISEDHRACPSNQIHSIPAMIDSLYSLSSSKQVQTKLNELMDSMTTLIDSKNVLLDRLGEVKNEALEKVTKFQKALEAVIKKVAEMSRKEIEDMHKKIEEEILSDKTDLKKTNDVLQVTSDKLNKADGNRAQSFVCTKIAEKMITETENELEGRTQNGNTDAQVYFTPNQSLMEYMNGLHGIGEVSLVSRQKTDLYKIVAVSQENAENKLLSNSKLVSFAENGEHMYVSDWDNGVVCFDGVGNHMSTFNDEDLRSVNGASVDGRGNIFAVGYKSHNVVQMNENGKKIGVVINEGLQYPQSACFDKNLNRLFVTMYDSNVVKMYELE